ncbi:MAG: hypothetical protein AAGI27_03600 [Pseudomonadota bacterium]
MSTDEDVMSLSEVLSGIEEVLLSRGGRNKPLLRSALYHLKNDAGGTRATHAEVDELHRLTGLAVASELLAYMNGEVTDADGNPKRMPGHVLQNANAFLRANGATTPVKGSKKIDPLAGLLEEDVGELSFEEAKKAVSFMGS